MEGKPEGSKQDGKTVAAGGGSSQHRSQGEMYVGGANGVNRVGFAPSLPARENNPYGPNRRVSARPKAEICKFLLKPWPAGNTARCKGDRRQEAGDRRRMALLCAG